MKWIQSTGGPLILLPEAAVPEWGGSAPPANGRAIEARSRWAGPGSPATDYDRACDISDLLGRIPVGPLWGVVFGEEPLRTAWVPDTVGGAVLRWQYARDESSILSGLDSMRTLSMGEPTLEIRVESSPWLLFDASDPGTDIGDYIRLGLLGGVYAIGTAMYAPDPDTSLVVHRIEKKIEVG